MSYNLFGFLFRNKNKSQDQPLSFAPPQNDDGAIVIEQGGAYTSVIDLDGIVKNEIELVTKYREIAQRAEVEGAISEIVNEALVTEEQKTPVALVTDKLNISEEIIQTIQSEFENILNLLDFNNEGQDIFRRWYTDGRLYFHIIIDPQNPRDGIQELRYIDPRRIKPVIEVETFVTQEGTPMQAEKQRYYVYNQFGTDATTATTGVKIAWDSICYVHSGIQETNNTMILGHVHKALKPANMLSMCFVGNTLVNTPTGYTAIRDLKAGDSVLCWDDNKLVPTIVKRQWSNGFRRVVHVKTTHHDFICTPEHPILVKHVGQATTEWKEAGDLTKQDSLVYGGVYDYCEQIPIPDCSRHGLRAKELAATVGCSESVMLAFFNGHTNLPITQGNLAVSLYDWEVETEERVRGQATILSLPEYVTPEFARLYGFLLGDGSVGKDSVSFAEGVKDEINLRYKGLMEQFFGPCLRQSSKTRRYTNYTVASVVAAETLRALGFSGDSHTKRFPEWIFRASAKVRRAMVDGFNDADGYQLHSTTEILHWRLNICNRELLDDIKTVWTSLGLCSGQIRTNKRYHSKSTLKGFDFARQYTSHTLQLSTLELPRYDRVKSVTKLDGTQEVFDIEILNASHAFVTNGVIVHNCEDASCIYRLSRAPERRIFFVDVGNLPKQKAEQYLKDIMSRYRNKMVYDATTGEVREDKKFLSFMEDYWLPRREGNRGTEITTLPGGENLGEMADIEYFKEKLYQSLNVPVGRLKSEAGFALGRAAEITRDEVKFGKFIYRVRNRFTQLFDGLLSTQLMLKGVIAKEDWSAIRQKVFYSFLKDTYFSEMKNLEVIRERLGVADSCLNYVGKYFSHQWVRRVILQQTDQEMETLDDQMLAEKSDPRYQAIEALTGMGAGMGAPGGMGMMPGIEGGMDPNDPNAPQDSNALVGGASGALGDSSANAGAMAAPGDSVDPSAQDTQQQAPPEDEEEPKIDLDDLPTERITKNIEALFRRN